MDFQPKILYEDKYVALCEKPVGFLSEPGGAKSLPDALAAYYAAKGESAYIATVHRLDKVTGGVMLFSRSRELTGALTAAIAERKFRKEYLAVLRGAPEKDSDTLEDLLFRDSAKNKTYVVTRMRKGVREASLSYETVGKAEANGKELTLVQVLLHTGRTHQIRAQFSSRGLPLLGDIRYGSKDADTSAALWAYRLTFTHPLTKKEISVCCPPPQSYPWNLFDFLKKP